MWQVDTIGWATPTFDETAVYFPTAHHQLVAIEKQSGKVMWIRDLPRISGRANDSSLTAGFGSTMAGGLVVAMDLALFGFSPRNGDVVWTFRPPERIQDISLPGSDGANVFTATPGGLIYSLDGATGAIRWQGFIGDTSAVPYSPVPAGQDVFASFTVRGSTAPDSGGVVAMDASTGAVKWIFHFPRTTAVTAPRGWMGVAVTDAYVLAPTEGTALYALNRKTGKVVWQGVPPDVAGQGIGAVAASGNRVFVGFNTGAVVALDQDSGRELWRFADIPFLVKRLTSDGDQLFVNYAGPLAVLMVPSGKLLWQTQFGSTASTVDSDRVYVAGSQGLYALARN